MWLAKQGSRQAGRVAQNESGAATGAVRALDSLLGFFKAQREGVGHFMGGLCTRQRHLDTNGL